MTTQSDKARAFAALHRPGAPVVIYNMWDAGSAIALHKAGAPAMATGSAPLAGAQGYADGQKIPLDLVLTLVGRIIACVPVPVSVDFEGGYAVEPAGITANTRRLIDAGAIGVNFEDQVVGGEGLYERSTQCARIAAVVAAGAAAEVSLFVNARTDLFLKAPAERHAELMPEALARLGAYAGAGTSGVFVPGLVDPGLIRAVVEGSALPVNVLMSPAAPPAAALAALGVARLSHGPFPWRTQMASFAEGFRQEVASLG